MAKHLKSGGNSNSASDLTALQSLKRVTFSTPRMLSASEIELLRQSKHEVARRVSELVKK